VAEGTSLHLGLNDLDGTHYVGYGGSGPMASKGALAAGEQDARDLATIASSQGFATRTMLGAEANAAAVADAVRGVAASLTDGDFFFLTFSGYGSQVPDRNSDERWSERSWALYDRQMPEDELTSLLALFGGNVRVLFLDDSSVSGTVRRDYVSFADVFDGDTPRTRALPPDVVSETYRVHQAQYDDIQRLCKPSSDADVAAAVVTMAACGPNQLAMDGKPNGVFTGTLMRVWDDARFEGDYRRFVNDVAILMPPTQIPQLACTGAGRSYVRERPFSI
jgi:metacaspase-1